MASYGADAGRRSQGLDHIWFCALAQTLARATGKYKCRNARHDKADTDHEPLTHHDPLHS